MITIINHFNERFCIIIAVLPGLLIHFCDTFTTKSL